MTGYEPRLLTSLKQICHFFGVGEKVVKRWLSAGAPIVVEGDDNNRRYSTEAMRLQLWRERQSEQKKKQLTEKT